MILTDSFVYIHMPKAGGTFVTSALFALYQGSTKTVSPEFDSWDVYYHPRYGQIIFFMGAKHGPCRNIPEAHRSKPILTSIRNPYDWYASQYEFSWWKRTENEGCFRCVPGFDEKYKHFPDITFEEFVLLVNSPFCRYSPNYEFRRLRSPSQESPGLYTERFLDLYFRNPRAVYPIINERYISARQYVDDMFPVQFIDMGHLNAELYHFLLGAGYQEEDVRFILDLDRIVPRGTTRDPERDWSGYYTPELKRVVREKEKLIFSIFPSFDV